MKLRLVCLSLLAFCLVAVACQPAQAQTFSVLHSFTGFPDGKTPVAGVSMDDAGILYGTTFEGGDGFCAFGGGCGTVYKLKRGGSGWILEVLQIFTGPNGLEPMARVVVGPDGALYGTTQGGGAFGAGTVFRLTPPPNLCHAVSCPWRETLVHEFNGSDGNEPSAEVVFDPAGNMYGTTQFGGSHGEGVAYKLTRSGNSWTYGVIYNFAGGSDASWIYAGLSRDAAGDLYGTSYNGGISNQGTVFELTPSGDSWQETVLHRFALADGIAPYGGVIVDPSGNLFGGTPIGGGMNCGGTTFELTPTSGGWNFNTIYCFLYHDNSDGPLADLSMDSAGNIYGTARYSGANQCGEVFKLTQQGGVWSRTVLHQFQNNGDGCEPMSRVLVDANGNLYGTTRRGGAHFSGVVWEIMP